MTTTHYINFDLLLEQEGERFVARVLEAPAGQARTSFTMPFMPLELENLVLKIGASRRGRRRLDTAPTRAAKELGGRIFEAIFAGEVGACLRSSMNLANGQGARLRIRLRLDAQRLAEFPWEYLYSSALNRFLALSSETSLVRYLELPLPMRPAVLSAPLRVLVVIASPTDYPQLAGEDEWQHLSRALQPLGSDQVQVERLERPTLAGLQEALRRGSYHVLHFVGHGAFDEQVHDGVLLFEDERRQGARVSSERLAIVLHNHPSLRLVVLNCCEGGRTSASERFSGPAQSLIQQGIPAIIAMQFEISDEGAVAFARVFYESLADGCPVDAALGEARTAMFAQRDDIDFGAPVLYMRSPDGILFHIERSGPRKRPGAFQRMAPGIRRWSRSSGVRVCLVVCAIGILVALGCAMYFKMLYADGRGVPPGPVHAARLRLACDKGNPVACALLGDAFKLGFGVAKDKAGAERLYDQACTGRNFAACVKQADQLLAGDGVPINREKASELYGRACDGGFKAGCAALNTTGKAGGPAPETLANGNAKNPAKRGRADRLTGQKGTGPLVPSAAAGRGGQSGAAGGRLPEPPASAAGAGSPGVAASPPRNGVPILTRFEPAKVTRGRHTITVYGGNFDASTKATFKGIEIEVRSVQFVSSQQLRLDIDVTGSAFEQCIKLTNQFGAIEYPIGYPGNLLVEGDDPTLKGVVLREGGQREIFVECPNLDATKEIEEELKGGEDYVSASLEVLPSPLQPPDGWRLEMVGAPVYHGVLRGRKVSVKVRLRNETGVCALGGAQFQVNLMVKKR
jgi:hypothetical protein